MVICQCHDGAKSNKWDDLLLVLTTSVATRSLRRILG